MISLFISIVIFLRHLCCGIELGFVYDLFSFERLLMSSNHPIKIYLIFARFLLMKTITVILNFIRNDPSLLIVMTNYVLIVLFSFLSEMADSNLCGMLKYYERNYSLVSKEIKIQN